MHLPKTGIESVISALVIGLMTSVVSLAAVWLVIRRLSAKERSAGMAGAVGTGVGVGADGDETML